MSSIYTRGGYALPSSSLDFKTGSWRTKKPVHLHAAAPCHHACPAGEDAQAYLALVEERRFREAWETLVSANPMPTVTGRVCHHPCETACNRSKMDSAIAIHNVERFLGEQALMRGWDYPMSPLPANAPAVAVVGAGPAGCSAAYHLRRQGIKVTLFEAMPQAGGLLATAIPHYRLPRLSLEGELERLLGCDIDFLPNHRLGRDVSIAELRTQFEAVFLGPGLQKPRPWNVDGAVPDDLHQGLDLLREWMHVGTLPQWNSVAVVGAGNTAVDMARVLKRAGVARVHIISHKAIPAADIPPEDTMPAIGREIFQALEEGVQIHEHRGVQRLVLRGERVTGIEVVHMKKLRGTDGRLRRVAFAGTESILPVDQVIPAVGQVLDATGLREVLHEGWFQFESYNGVLKQHNNVYVGGDARGDHGTVSEAIGDGRRAALAIAARLRGDAAPAEHKREPIGVERLNLHYFEPGDRPEQPMLPVAERDAETEIELCLGENQVVAEGERCLSCGNCMACDNCWNLCPDSSVLKTREKASDGSHYVFDYDYCKGCGLCAHECPVGYINMIDEG